MFSTKSSQVRAWLFIEKDVNQALQVKDLILLGMVIQNQYVRM